MAQCLYMYIGFVCSFGRSSCPNSEAVCVELLLPETNSGEEYGQRCVEGLPCHIGPLANGEKWPGQDLLAAK